MLTPPSDPIPALISTPSAPPPSDSKTLRPQSCRELFIAFTLLALQGFGGVLAVAERVLCEQRRWLSKAEFVEVLSLSQVLPGPNVCNMALMIGDRFFGWRGAAAALAGMMLVPFVIVLVLTQVYVQYSSIAWVAGALNGMGVVAAGMIVGTALRLIGGLKSNAMGLAACGAVGLATFATVALLRWPLVWVLASVGSLAYLLAWRKLKAQAPA